MKRILNTLFLLFVSTVIVAQLNVNLNKVRTNVPLDSIRLSDPFVFADKATRTYYMTGTGGLMWKSSNLKTWSGPYVVADVDSSSWMGAKPMIWAAEIHKANNRYYYFATFTNRTATIDTVANNVVPRRACYVLASDKPDGPYRPFGKDNYLPADMSTLDGTFWVDEDKKPYMVFCHEWLQNLNGTIEKVMLEDDLSGTKGGRALLFKASDSPWSREKDSEGRDRPNKVTDGPFLFKTGKGTLGMLWTSWVYDVYTQGVAYSQSGTLDGPWIQEPDPVTPANFGHGMIFTDFAGRKLMAVHSHSKNASGNVIRVPHFFLLNMKGDKIVVVREYMP